MNGSPSALTVPHRILMGPGPSDTPPEVLRALSLPTLGHLDPAFLGIMDEVKEMLRTVFLTDNEFAIPISGTGSAGMETALVNMIEPGDGVIVCVSGVFGRRMCDIVERCGGVLKQIEVEWGTPVDPEVVARAFEEYSAQVLCIVHAETSTGVLQPMEEISAITKSHQALLVMDAVTSLGGAPVRTDEWSVDVCYSGTQKCLSCPPGLAPITFSSRALDKLRNRSHRVPSWYLDMTMVEKYWGPERVYHHTAPINMIYALREALRLAIEEGLEARWERHRALHSELVAGIEALGLEMLVEKPYRAPMLNAVKVPGGVDDALLRRRLLEEYEIEIGSGLGPLKGKIWRVGLMGYSCKRENVSLFLDALKKLL